MAGVTGMLLLLLLVAGCGGGAADEAEVDPVVAIEEFHPSDNARTAIGRINAAARGDPDALRDAALANIDSSDPDIRFAAVYGLSVSARPDDTDAVEALTELLGSSSVDERLNAAGSLAAMGVKEAIPVLIELLGSDENLSYVVLPAWRVARDMLLTYTTEDLGLRQAETREDTVAAQPEWEAWWSERGPALEWNQARGEFE